MKDHHKDKHHSEHSHHGHHKAHHHHQGSGMPYFEKDHWQHEVVDTITTDGRYSSEMNQAAEYKHSVDELAHYAKKHKAQH